MEKEKYVFKGVWIPKEIWLATDITWMEKCLLAEISALDGDENCNASNEYLANKFGSSAASIANQISKLRKLDYIEHVSFDGRRRRIKVKADLTLRLRQEKPSSEDSLNCPVNALIEENKVEQKEEKESPATPSRKDVEVSDRGLAFAQWFKTTLPETTKVSPGWEQKWAKLYDDMIRLDARTPEQIAKACRWARADSFWSNQFFSPMKLRDKKDDVQYFDIFLAKSNETPKTNGRTSAHARTADDRDTDRTGLRPAQISVRRL